ncbi:MAG: proteic killer suppression protein [Candidatus Kentron sp. G]|nr:MAG: proteic killer suppression protein [Candidatus Kentron sp. G]VFN06467.1 MAG: proteic killer suppression protein [Candidatus Kentron sp. G]
MNKITAQSGIFFSGNHLNLATRLSDLRTPPGNRLHALEGDRKGQHSISINDQWRICFRFENGNAYDVQVCDYH